MELHPQSNFYSFDTINSTILESGSLFDESQSKYEDVNNDEEKYQEPPPYVPPISIPQRLKKSILEDRVKMNKGNIGRVTNLGKTKERNLRSKYSLMIEHDK